MIDLFLLPFFERALLVGLILGVLMAVLGVIIVLRRLSFFADAIGHSALTGIAIGLLLTINPFIAALGFALLVAASVTYLRRFSRLHLDTLLGVFFPAAVALGVILVQQFPGYQADLMAYLFGDILTVTKLDIFLSLGLAIIVGIALTLTGKKLISIAFDEALARAEGVPVVKYEFLLMMVLAAVIALAIKLVGIILVTAMLVIPAATAQNISRSLAGMFVGSVVVSLLSVIIGMVVSATLATPSGPTIVLASTAFFALSFIGKALRS